VTVSSWLIMIGSATVILLAFAGISELRSVETRTVVRDSIKQWPLNQLGLDLDSALRLIQISSMIAGGCAAATTILGFYAFQRNRQARIALSVLAPILLVTGLATGGFLVTMVAVASLTLWLQPARDWFNGVPASARPNPVNSPSPRALNEPDRQQGARSVAPSIGRPKAVTTACLAAWGGSGLALLFTALSLAVLRSNPDAVIAELEKQQPEAFANGVTADLLISTSYVVGGLVIVWSVATLVLTTLVFRGVPWARIALIASGSTATVLTLFAAIGAAVMLPMVLVCALSVSMLLRPEARSWFVERHDPEPTAGPRPDSRP